jgi:hypothetical protein
MGGVANISSLRIAFAVAALFTIGVGAGAGLLGRERLDLTWAKLVRTGLAVNVVERFAKVVG